MVHCTAVALHVAQFDDGSSAAHVPADVDVMQYGVCPLSWLHAVHTLTPPVEVEHVAQLVDRPHVAPVPGAVMQYPAVQAEQPGFSLVWLHVLHPLIVAPTVGHVSDPDVKQLVPAHTVHCAGPEALHVVQVEESFGVHVPAVFDMQYCVSPLIWLHSVHTLTPPVEEEHEAQSVDRPHVAPVPGLVMQPGAVQDEQPGLVASWPHVAHPLIRIPTTGHVSDPFL